MIPLYVEQKYVIESWTVYNCVLMLPLSFFLISYQYIPLVIAFAVGQHIILVDRIEDSRAAAYDAVVITEFILGFAEEQFAFVDEGYVVGYFLQIAGNMR